MSQPLTERTEGAGPERIEPLVGGRDRCRADRQEEDSKERGREDSHAAFVRDPVELEDDVIDFDLEPRTGEVPAEFLREQAGEIELLNALSGSGLVEWHG